MVDTIFVGRTIGSEAIGALTIAFPVQCFIISIGLFFAIGASTSAAASLGEGDNEKFKSIITNVLTLMFFSIAIITLIICGFKDPIITFLGATDNIYPYANEYISIIVYGAFFQCFTVIIGYIMTALGNAKVNLIATSLGAICNIIIDYLLVIIFSLGVKGAAIATVTSQIVSSIYIFYHFMKIKKKFDLSLNFTLNKEISLLIVSIGFSTFIVEISDAVVAVVLNNFLKPYGDSALIIIGVISRVSMFMYITMIGITSAMQPMVAYNYGAENFKRIKEIVKKSITAVTLTSVLLWIFMMIFSKEIIGSFLKEKDILSMAVRDFRIVICIFPCVSIYYMAVYYYQAVGQAKFSLMLSIYRQMLIFIPLLIIFVKIFGLMGAWIAYPVSDIISSFIGFLYMKKAAVNMEQKYKQYEKRKIKSAYRGVFNTLR
jgi:putative MATE family efflux protein